MIELAGCAPGERMSLREIAQRQQISEKYLEAIMKKLVEGGLVSGLRGKRGGYWLARPAQQCTVGDILRIAEGSLAPVACLEAGAQACPRRDGCVTLPMWKELEKVVGDFFDGIDLAQLAAQAGALSNGVRGV